LEAAVLSSLRRKRQDGVEAKETLNLYYASDVHGSEQCWRKFLGAGRFYGVSAIIMGGDLTGKAIVPITMDGAAFKVHFLGEDQAGEGEGELEKLEAAIRYNGMYPWRATAGEVRAAQADASIQAELFEHVMVEELRRWIELADERMAEYGIDVYVMPGNDDPWSCDSVLEGAAHVQACDDRVVRVGEHEMISCAYASPTPWNSPRELDENALYERIKRLADQVESPETAIFNLHVPPYDTGLDTANEINPDLTLVYKSGQPNPIPVGSTAVRQIIEEYQPLLGLHGHIHESRGEARIGRTLCINSGSEYNSGRIHGVTVKLTPSEVVSHQFVIG
jgi:Icc-related predicted phosphoesterase